MNELTTFEQALTERLRADAVRRARPFDPAAIAATARERAPGRHVGLHVSMRLVFVGVFTALLLLALMASVFFFGQPSAPDKTPDSTPQPTLAAAPAPTLAASAEPSPTTSPETTSTAGPEQTSSGVPDTGRICSGGKREPLSEALVVKITAAEGCLEISAGTWLQLDLHTEMSGFEPVDLQFTGNRSSPYIRRWTQAHITLLATGAGYACPREVGSAGSWPDSITLNEIGTDLLCVLTNEGAVVELGLEPYDPRVGALTIHYRTVDDTVP